MQTLTAAMLATAAAAFLIGCCCQVTATHVGALPPIEVRPESTDSDAASESAPVRGVPREAAAPDDTGEYPAEVFTYPSVQLMHRPRGDPVQRAAQEALAESNVPFQRAIRAVRMSSTHVPRARYRDALLALLSAETLEDYRLRDLLDFEAVRRPPSADDEATSPPLPPLTDLPPSNRAQPVSRFLREPRTDGGPDPDIQLTTMPASYKRVRASLLAVCLGAKVPVRIESTESDRIVITVPRSRFQDAIKAIVYAKDLRDVSLRTLLEGFPDPAEAGTEREVW